MSPFFVGLFLGIFSALFTIVILAIIINVFDDTEKIEEAQDKVLKKIREKGYQERKDIADQYIQKLHPKSDLR